MLQLRDTATPEGESPSAHPRQQEDEAGSQRALPLQRKENKTRGTRDSEGAHVDGESRMQRCRLEKQGSVRRALWRRVTHGKMFKMPMTLKQKHEGRMRGA